MGVVSIFIRLSLKAPAGVDGPIERHFVVSDKLHYDPDEVYSKGMSPFESVVVAAQEARFINEQARLGFLDLKGIKPTTVALDRLREGKVKVSIEE